MTMNWYNYIKIYCTQNYSGKSQHPFDLGNKTLTVAHSPGLSR